MERLIGAADGDCGGMCVSGAAKMFKHVVNEVLGVGVTLARP